VAPPKNKQKSVFVRFLKFSFKKFPVRIQRVHLAITTLLDRLQLTELKPG